MVDHVASARHEIGVRKAVEARDGRLVRTLLSRGLVMIGDRAGAW